MNPRLTKAIGGIYGYADEVNHPITKKEQELLNAMGEIEDFEEEHNVDILSIVRCFDRVELTFETDTDPDEEMLRGVLDDDVKYGTHTYYTGTKCHVIGTMAQINNMIDEYELTDYSIKRR